jgi:hypothetical protein
MSRASNEPHAADLAIPLCLQFKAQRREAADAERWAMNNAPKQWHLAGTVLLLAVCTLVQGCVGAGISWTHTAGCADPDLESLQHGELRSRGGADTNDTPAWLETSWGKPTSVRRVGKEGTTEVWTYRHGLNWNGAVLFVLIPIPLEAPVGHVSTQVVIRDGRVIRAKLRSTHAGGGVLGWTVRSDFGDFGFHSLSDFQ